MRLIGPNSWFGRFGEEKNLLSLLGFEPPARSARNLIAIPRTLNVFLMYVLDRSGRENEAWRFIINTFTVGLTVARAIKRKEVLCCPDVIAARTRCGCERYASIF
jgi:hypothetical protein